MKRLLLLFLCFPVALATSYPAFTLEELYTRADIVLYGTVENAEESRDGTEVTLRDHVVLLGDETIDTLRWNGTMDIAGLTVPAAGTEILAFAYTNQESRSPIVGFTRGLFTERDNHYVNEGGLYIALSSAGELSLTERASDGADASDVREALGAPTFAEAPDTLDATPDPAEEPADDTGATDIHEISLAVAAEVHSEPTFTRALAVWNDALRNQAIIVAEVSDNPVITVGNAADLGDAISVTFRDAERLISEVNVRAGRALVFNALLVEIGVHAGAQPGTSPALTSALPTTERSVTAADTAAVLARAVELPGDINQDGVVDFLDLVLLAAQHGERGINLPGDLNDDGVVDDADVAILQEHYSFTAPEKP